MDLYFRIRRKKHKLYRVLKRFRGRLLHALGRYRNFSWEGKRTCFILSTGRTGTTFLGDHFFPRLSGVTAFHEPQPDFFDVGTAGARGSLDLQAVADDLRANRMWVLERMERDDSELYAEANHYLFSLVPVLSNLFPDPHFIHVVRDGRDVVRSAYSRGWYRPSSRYDRIAAPDLPDDPWASEWPRLSRFERIAWYWQATDRIIETGLADVDRSLLVYFEDMFESPPDYPGMATLLSFLGLKASGWQPMLEQPRRASAHYKLPHWTDWDRRRRREFWRIAGERMAHHGYTWEKDET